MHGKKGEDIRRLGIGTKFLIGYIGIILLLGLSVIVFVNTTLARRLTSELEKRGARIAKDLAEMAVSPLLTDNTLSLQIMLDEYRQTEEDIEYIFVLDKAGTVLAHTFGEAFPTELIGANPTVIPGQHHNIVTLSTERGVVFDISEPLLRGEAGFLRLGMSEKPIRLSVAAITGVLAWIVAGVLVVGLVISYAYARAVTGPIIELKEAAEAIERGDFGRRAVVKTGDEAGRLSASFNNMVETLQRTAEELKAENLERKRAEAAIRESEERFREIFEQNEDAIIIFEPGSCTVFDANPAAEKIFGYKKDEMLGRGLELLFEGNEEELSCGEMTGRIELDRRMCRGKDGRMILVSVRGKLVRLHDRSVLYCSFRDITERVRMEEEARFREAQLVQANKMASLGTLVSGVAHEINNPNNFIMFNAPLVLSAWQDAAKILEEHYRENGDFPVGGLQYSKMRDVVPELFSGITEGAERIKNIVDNLRDFAKQDSSGMNEPVDVNRAVRTALTIIDNQIRKYTEYLHVDFGEALPPVRGSSQQIEQVMINVMLNALQALPDRNRGVRVSTSFDPAAGFVAMEVRDEGIGISRATLEHIMEPFFTTRLQSGGTGLGLSITYSIVKAHGGSIEFASEPGKGTTATVRLPAMS